MEYLDSDVKTERGSFIAANNSPVPVAVGMPEIIKATDFTCPTSTANNDVVLAVGDIDADATRCIVMNIHATAPAYLNNTAPASNTDGLRLAVGESWHFRPSKVPFAIGTAAATLKVIQLG